MRLAIVPIAVSGFMFVSAARSADMDVSATATTNELNRASPSFELTGLVGGQKLATANWLVELKIGATNVNVENCALNSLEGGKAGRIDAPVNVAAGNHSVTIKVKLNDGTTVTKTKTVDFQKIAEGGPPCPPGS